MARKRNGWVFTSRNQILALICSILMILGIIFSFFCCGLGLTGGALVGLAVGLYFAYPLHDYVLQVRSQFGTSDAFRLMMILGTLLYFLIVATTFVIAVVLGIVIMTLINHRQKQG